MFDKKYFANQPTLMAINSILIDTFKLHSENDIMFCLHLYQLGFLTSEEIIALEMADFGGRYVGQPDSYVFEWKFVHLPTKFEIPEKIADIYKPLSHHKVALLRPDKQDLFLNIIEEFDNMIIKIL